MIADSVLPLKNFNLRGQESACKAEFCREVAFLGLLTSAPYPWVQLLGGQCRSVTMLRGGVQRQSLTRTRKTQKGFSRPVEFTLWNEN